MNIDGWTRKINGHPMPETLLDVKFPDGMSSHGVYAHLIGWDDVEQFRPHQPVEEDAPPVTLNDARKAQLHIEAVFESQDAIFVNQVKEQWETLTSYLNESVAREVVKNESCDKLRVQNNALCGRLEKAAWVEYQNAELLQIGSNLRTRLSIAIARGYVPVNFEAQLREWAA